MFTSARAASMRNLGAVPGRDGIPRKGNEGEASLHPGPADRGGSAGRG